MPPMASGRLYNWLEAGSNPDPAGVATLAREAGCPPWLAAMLIRRGIASPAALDEWRHPRLARLDDPFHLPGMEAAVGRALTAIDRHERITLFGDYDVDGITGTALLHIVLAASGVPVTPFLPHRLEEGYGLSPDALRRCLEETNPGLIITVDCGTGSVAAVQAARAAGVDVIITDHHTLGAEIAPAVAVVNPRMSPREADHVLAGVGVAFKLAHALLKRARQCAEPPEWARLDPRHLLDLVALGTICDLVPLTDENRILVTHGLKLLNAGGRAGLEALREVAGGKKAIGAYEVGFMLGPRLNAAGRLGTAQAALRLLLTRDPGEAMELARMLDAANRERQAVERATVEEVHERVNRLMAKGPCHSIVEADPGWHPGVVGIVAARMIQKHGRPAIIIGADDHGRAKGSGRGISGFNLVEALDECRVHLIKHGGHAMAAGLEIAWENIDAFRQAFEAAAARRLAGHPFIPELRLEGWIEVADITGEVAGLLEQLGPYGVGHHEPLWGCRGLEWAAPPREVGTGHLKARFRNDGKPLDAIGFGLYHADLPPAPWHAAFHIRREVFRGQENIVLHLKDMGPGV